MTLAEFKDYASIGAFIMSAGGVFYTWLTARSKSNSEDIKAIHSDFAEVKKDVEDIEARLRVIDSEWKHLPDKETINDLKISMTEMRGTVNTLNESLKSIARTVGLIDEYMRKDRTK
ncbi:MAG: DUF2730 family protein [Alphaproteobacteria bacterium]|nr:DUF2730 family protein [Alphaproteobacteria bacterium]